MSWEITGSEVSGNNVEWELPIGAYPPCGAAKSVSKISKYMTFGPGNGPCTSSTMAQVPGNKINKEDKFVTEHVFEAQVLTQFFNKYLLTNSMPTGYERPTAAWITQALLGFQMGLQTTNKDPYYMPQSAELGMDEDSDAWSVLTKKIGSSTIPENLVIAIKGMNGVKGKLFERANPIILTGPGKTFRFDQIAVRDVSFIHLFHEFVIRAFFQYKPPNP